MILNFFNSVVVALLVIFICFVPVLAANDETDPPQRAAVSLGAEFFSGDYGTDNTIRSLYLPLVVTWLPTERLNLGIEIPFIYQSSSAVTTGLYRSGTMMVQATEGDSGGNGNIGGNTLQQPRDSTSSTSSVSGLGDIILRLGVIAHFEDEKTPQLRPSLFLKCPTAKVSDNLGTGEYDFGAGLEASKWIGNLYLNGEGFYVWQGKAEGFGLKDYLSLSGSVGYLLTANLEPMLIIKKESAPSIYSGDLLEVRARLLFLLSEKTSLDLFLSKGLSTSSPDYGGGLTVSYSF